MSELLSIVTDILLPILLLAGAGVWLRGRFDVDMSTLVKLNLYVFSPAFIFRYVATSTLAGETMLAIMGVSAVLATVLGGMAWGLGRSAGATWRTTSAVMLGCMMYNSGNYGLPLAELAFGRRGAEAQVFVLTTQSVLTFTVGLALASSAVGGGWRRSVQMMLRLPILYALAAGLGWNFLLADRSMPLWLDKTTAYLAAGLVPMALVTLGAQLAHEPRWPRWRPVGTVLVIRLLAAPALMGAMLYALHRLVPGTPLDLWPWPAALLIVTAGMPTAVYTLLLTLEVEGDARLAADAVFWTTILSALTIVGWIAVVRWTVM